MPDRKRAGVIASWADDRLGLGTVNRRMFSLRKVFPDHWSFMLGEIALWSFVVLLVTGVFLTLWFDPSMAEVTYQGSYDQLARRTDVRRVRLDARHLLRRPWRAADPADAPLGGAHLHRRDADPPVAARADRQLPQAPGDQLAHRLPDAAARHPRGVPRLLAARRPALRHRPPRRRRVPEGDPGRRHLPVILAVRRRVPRRRRRSRGCSSSTSC